MSRKRLTREDSRERTIQRLLRAARKLIAKKGFGDTTVDDIAEEASYTRGAFYSNFSSKGDLFIELLRRDHYGTNEQLRAMRDDSVPVEHIQQCILAVYGQMYHNDESFMSWIEARILAARDAEFRVKFHILLAQRYAQVAELIDYFYRRAGITPPLASTALAICFNSLFEGVKLATLSSPGSVRPEGAESMLTSFVELLTCTYHPR
jgi:AcrR family transcriptional regulator